MLDGRDDALEFRRCGGHRLRTLPEQRPRGARVEGQREVAVPEEKVAVRKFHAKAAAFEHAPILFAEHGQQHFVAEFVFERMPINVEKICVLRRRPIFQDIAPPRIQRALDAHVVRDEIRDEREAVRF